VEPVIVAHADGLWLGLGSDHTDRKAERMGIALSKQLCAKPLAPALWRFDEVSGHWDELALRAHATIGGKRVVYQDGRLAAMRHPSDLIARMNAGATLAPGTVMFCGTLAAVGGIRPASRFEMELNDPVLGRTITHGYDVVALPVVS
jgi:2-keto-4-pentenoate hydratase/2-oxohepta-3-ene-1,7-dioic acid hydratase in catechol pathway